MLALIVADSLHKLNPTALPTTLVADALWPWSLLADWFVRANGSIYHYTSDVRLRCEVSILS